MNKTIEAAMSHMIISASGWRGVFATGGEESRETAISDAHTAIVRCAAAAFARFNKEKDGGCAEIVVARDTRPTGAAIAAVIVEELRNNGITVLYGGDSVTGVMAAPEVMAFAASRGAPFVYVSASHNPIGHNGIKFGGRDGSVLQASDNARLTEIFRLLAENAKIESKRKTKESDDDLDLKNAALAEYTNFAWTVFSGGNARLSDELQRSIRQKKLGIAADLNGSARCASIDRSFFQSLGLEYAVINDEAGAIAHRIVPEGDSLNDTCAFLEKKHAEDAAFQIAYMPDCDGDRGNLVYWSEKKRRALPVPAQQVFALAVAAELAHLVWTGEFNDKVAVAVNDGTSLRIDEIAAFFGAKVARAEIGEANVVGLARELREKGFIVRIMGEGAAGGNITHPQAVRDPLSTLMAAVKLLRLPGLVDMYREKAALVPMKNTNWTVEDILESLPAWVTTSVYEEEAVLRVKTTDHAALKGRYEAIFRSEWEKRRSGLAQQYGFALWKAFVYNGLRERELDTNAIPPDSFSMAGRGGLRIVFYDEKGAARGVIWMRGSGTEPVFRIMAEAKGGDERAAAAERDLIFWQRAMVEQADRLSADQKGA